MTYPIRKYPAAFICLTLALLLPDTLLSEPLGSDFFLRRLCSLLLYSALVYLLLGITSLGARWSRWLGGALLVMVHVLVFGLAMTDWFLCKYFWTHINTFILQLINETTDGESSEFLSSYVFKLSFFKKELPFFALLGLELLLCFLFRRLNRKSGNAQHGRVSIPGIALNTYIILSLGYMLWLLPTFSSDWAENLNAVETTELTPTSGISRSFVFRTYQSALQFYDENHSLERCSQSQQLAKGATAGQSSTDIVVIIGESFCRHHSSLYGYGHVTNPRLSQLDNLYVFDDVITSVNGTSQAFKDFLSMSSVDDSLSWSDTPLFPALFKEAGYNVVFYSNQFVQSLNVNAFDASCGFFNHPAVEPWLFDHRNTRKSRYDEGLVDDYREHRSEVEADSANLIFFHLIGQHINPAKRFPEGRDVFKAEDYAYRHELTDEQRQQVANYDNATLYNDSVVHEIIDLYKDKDAIVLYFSDHGDEANDYRAQIGRAKNIDLLGAPCLHCQLDIPFMLWMSDRSIERHPGLQLRIADAIHKPFMLDDLPHLLLDISEVQTPWFQPSRSPISEQYNEQRHRFLNRDCVSQPTDYDAVCNDYGPWQIGF